MGRTALELLGDLFKTGASDEYKKLRAALVEKNESLEYRGFSDSNVRARVITQMFVDCYEAVLVYIVGQLEIPAEAIGVRTQDDAEMFLNDFESDAEALRNRFELKRDKQLATLGVDWRRTDDYERKTTHLKDKAKADVSLHLTATLKPEAKAREDAWKRLHQVVDGQMTSKAHDIEDDAKNRVKALGRRIPPPKEAYDSGHVASMYLKGMRERIDFIFKLYPDVVKQLRLDVDGLHSVIRTHVNSLVDEAVRDYRRIVAEEFQKWGPEVPQEVVDKAVNTARSSVVANTEMMLVALDRLPTQEEEKPPADRKVESSATIQPTGDLSMVHHRPLAADRPVPVELGGRYVPKIEVVREHQPPPTSASAPHQPDLPKKDKSLLHQIIVGTVVGIVLAVGGLGAYWVQKNLIDPPVDARNARTTDRKAITAEVTPKITACVRAANDLYAVASTRDLGARPLPTKTVNAAESTFAAGCAGWDPYDVVLKERITLAYDSLTALRYQYLASHPAALGNTSRAYISEANASAALDADVRRAYHELIEGAATTQRMLSEYKGK